MGVLITSLFMLLGFAVYAVAEVNFSTTTQEDSYQNFSFLSATTTTATSTNLTGGGGYATIAGATEVAFVFSRGGATGPNTGSTQFKVQVTPDGSNWYDYNTLFQNAATGTAPTTLASVTIAAATSSVVTYMQNLGWYGVRCIAVETTDGDHTCSAAITF